MDNLNIPTDRIHHDGPEKEIVPSKSTIVFDIINIFRNCKKITLCATLFVYFKVKSIKN